MSKKITGLALCALLFALSVPVEAQQPTKVPRIGVLRNDTPSLAGARDEAVLQRLHELGYVEGKNILIEYRYAEGKLDRLPDLAAELVRLKVDIIVTAGGGATRSAKNATTTIPIVVGSAGDLVKDGLVASLAKPGGNITGSTDISSDVSGKRLELLKEVFPNASRVAILFYPNPTDRDEVRETEIAATGLGVKIQPIEVRDPSEFDDAFARMAKQHANALVIVQGTGTTVNRRKLLELALKRRLPSLCENSIWTNDGCLMSYGPELLHPWRRAADFVDKILKGTKPADIPVEQPMKFELIINLKTAKQLGLTMPPYVLGRADKVIR